MILSTLGRLLVMTLAFITAAVVGLLVLFTLGTIWAGAEIFELAEGDPLLELHSRFVGAVIFTSAVAPALSVVPGLLAAIAGEVLRLRSWIYYVPAGGAALAVIPLLVAPEVRSAPAPDYMTIFASAGFAAGFVYWLLAGRRA